MIDRATSVAMPDRALGTALRLSGAVWGHLVGDAVGVPYEFREPAAVGEIRWGESGTHAQPPGTWSDDGALMLALLDSLLSVGFDVEDQGRRSVVWFRDGAYTPDGDGLFDIGNTTRRALAAIDGGADAADGGPSGEFDGGNGSLMRILPVALVGRELAEAELIDQAMGASRVTHGNPRAQVACALYVLVAARLVAGQQDRAQALEESRRVLRAEVEGVPTLLDALDYLEGWTEREGRGRVWDSFWSAWDALAGAGSYQETIERAIAYGNDTDTTAATAGGLAGAYWGIDGIPGPWLDGMQGREVVAPLVDRLLATAGWRTSTTNPIRVDWVDLASVPGLRGVSESGGHLGMTFLPGKQRDGWSGMHWRDLAADARALREDHGVDTLLLLVEDHELKAARVPDIATVLPQRGIELLRFPIRDMDVTQNREGLRGTLDDVLARLRGGQSVAVACRGGLGRTGTVVACLLRDGGLDGDEAIALTRASRKKTVERGSHVEFVHDWSWPGPSDAS